MIKCYTVSTVTCSKYNTAYTHNRVYIHHYYIYMLREFPHYLILTSIKQSVHISDSQSAIDSTSDIRSLIDCC